MVIELIMAVLFAGKIGCLIYLVYCFNELANIEKEKQRIRNMTIAELFAEDEKNKVEVE